MIGGDSKLKHALARRNSGLHKLQEIHHSGRVTQTSTPMVRFCKRQASIKAVESALENNVAVQAITDALGVDDNDGSDDADEDTSLDEEDLNEGLLIYLRAIHSQQYFVGSPLLQATATGS
ncbi:hypothetical protein Pst134EB_006582 [Puccinia striiformis f. sp. tritici]|nr:hypothetical protein Pst134EB_006582 [Puccinia striiformis f. sp. tritici]